MWFLFGVSSDTFSGLLSDHVIVYVFFLARGLLLWGMVSEFVFGVPLWVFVFGVCCRCLGNVCFRGLFSGSGKILEGDTR